MIHVTKIAILFVVVAVITACGGSGSGGSAGQTSISGSLEPTSVSSDGQVVARAAFGGGVESSNTTPLKSIQITSPHTSAQSVAIDLLVSKIIQDVRNDVGESSQVKTITIFTNPQNTAGTIKFSDEKVAVGNSYITFNGEFSAKKVDELHVTGSGTLSAKQEDVGVTISKDETTYEEVVNGTVTFEMSLALTYTQNASGQINGYKTSGDVTLKGSDISVSGGVSGTVSSMNAKYHYESVDDFKGTAIVSESCDGYLAVNVNGEQAVCGLLSTCDGCE